MSIAETVNEADLDRGNPTTVFEIEDNTGNKLISNTFKVNKETKLKVPQNNEFDITPKDDKDVHTINIWAVIPST
jgi:hypothetical protein